MHMTVETTSGGGGGAGDGSGFASGPLLINAIGVVLSTYHASFSSLILHRALTEYDLRVPVVLARPRCCDKYHKIIAIFAVILLEGSLIYYLFSTGNKAGRVFAEIILKGFCSLVALKGFLSLTEFCPSGLEVFRRPFHGVAILKVHKIRGSSTQRGVLAALCVALALYSVSYPNILLESAAMLGVGASVIRNPTFFSPRLSIRRVTVVLALLPALALVVSSVMCVIAGDAKQNPTPSWMKFWLLSAFQFWGIGGAGVLTALVLRYEHSISDPSCQHLAAENPTSPQSKGVLRVFTKEAAFAARVSVMRERPQFRRPLFRTLIFLSFLVHVLPAALVLCTEVWTRTMDYLPMWARVGAELPVLLPAQLWAAFVLPAAVGFSCLLRADGAELWQYSEVWVRPTMQTAELSNIVAVTELEQHATSPSAEKARVEV